MCAQGKSRPCSANRSFWRPGRQSNADLLQVDAAGIATDARGYVVVNEYLETNVKNIWAFGDITGRYMFRHMANEESSYAWHNSQHGHRAAVPYHAVPHAVFTYPQIASVGLTEREARRGHSVLVGLTPYASVAMGEAMLEHDGFAKAVVERSTGRILGFHIIGPQASILIQEVINAMASGGSRSPSGAPCTFTRPCPSSLSGRSTTSTTTEATRRMRELSVYCVPGARCSTRGPWQAYAPRKPIHSVVGRSSIFQCKHS